MLHFSQPYSVFGKTSLLNYSNYLRNPPMSLYHIDFFRPFFQLLKVTDRRTDKQTYLPVEMQFYISVIFLGLPDDEYEKLQNMQF